MNDPKEYVVAIIIGILLWTMFALVLHDESKKEVRKTQTQNVLTILK